MSKTPRTDALKWELFGSVALSETSFEGKMVRHARTLELELATKDALLREALTTINGLVEQQAMPDEWWKSTAERIRRAMGES